MPVVLNLQKKRWEVSEESCIQTSETLQKPDLAAIKDDRDCVVDLQIVSQQSMDVTHENKEPIGAR